MSLENHEDVRAHKTADISTRKGKGHFSGSDKLRVAVCVITYLRPEGLKRLMDGLNNLVFDKSEAPNLEIIVIDNDPSGLACIYCNRIRSDLNWPLKCFVEPRRGIPYARNKAIACAEQPDFIAFIDDDEVPEPTWLDELLYVQQLFSADGVMGPALPRFVVPVEGSFLSEEFFARARYPTGYPMPWISTQNILIRSEVFEKMDKVFDERFALSGGSDQHFFVRACRAGYKFVWADEALVYEWVPKSRTNLRWLLQRSYRYGNIDSLVHTEFNPSIEERANLVAEGIKGIVRGLLNLIVLSKRLGVKFRSPVKIRIRLRVRFRSPVVIQGPHRPLVGPLRRISYGAGMLAGVAGKRYEEYRRTHIV